MLAIALLPWVSVPKPVPWFIWNSRASSRKSGAVETRLSPPAMRTALSPFSVKPADFTALNFLPVLLFTVVYSGGKAYHQPFLVSVKLFDAFAEWLSYFSFFPPSFFATYLFLAISNDSKEASRGWKFNFHTRVYEEINLPDFQSLYRSRFPRHER